CSRAHWSAISFNSPCASDSARIQTSGVERLAHALQRLVVRLGQENQRGQRTDQCEKHVALCIPHVALRAEKCVCATSAQHSSPPFEQLIKCAEGQRHADTGKT